MTWKVDNTVRADFINFLTTLRKMDAKAFNVMYDQRNEMGEMQHFNSGQTCIIYIHGSGAYIIR